MILPDPITCVPLFVGAVIVILLFVLFLVQGLWLAFHAENRYCRSEEHTSELQSH